MKWFTSDTHFGHARIIELCSRPFADIDEMDNAIIDNWNNAVGPDDEVFHLGDVALGPKDRWQNIFSQLNGKLNLLIGNHDALFRGNKQTYRDKWGYLYDNFTVLGGTTLEVIDGHAVLLAHFPYDEDYQGRGFFTPDTLGFPLVHGHTHGKEHASLSKNRIPQFHVGMDAWGFCPVPEDTIIAWLRSLDWSGVK